MRANGIDFSYWAPAYDYPEEMSGQLVGVEFVVHRVAYGIQEDKRLVQHVEASRQVKVREGYLYYRMGDPWYRQYENAVTLAEKFNLVNIWWDAEEDLYTNTFGPKFVAETSEGLRYLQTAFPGAGLYCNLDIYYRLERAVDWEWLAEIPLWIANPQYGHTIDYYIDGNGEPHWRVYRGGVWVNLKRPVGSWTFWQTGFRGVPEWYGISGKEAVDENVFNGTVGELFALRGIETELSEDEISEIELSRYTREWKRNIRRNENEFIRMDR